MQSHRVRWGLGRGVQEPIPPTDFPSLPEMHPSVCKSVSSWFSAASSTQQPIFEVLLMIGTLLDARNIVIILILS